MGKAPNHRSGGTKPATEWSPARAEQFRSQVTRATWRYAAQGPMAQKVKSHVYRLGTPIEQPAGRGMGISVKVALLMIVGTVVGAAAWRALDVRRDGFGEASSRRAGGKAPL